MCHLCVSCLVLEAHATVHIIWSLAILSITCIAAMNNCKSFHPQRSSSVTKLTETFTVKTSYCCKAKVQYHSSLQVLQDSPFCRVTCCGPLLPLQPDIHRNYQNISFFPHQFHGYLLSEEVGFTRYVKLGIPKTKTKGETFECTKCCTTQDCVQKFRELLLK